MEKIENEIFLKKKMDLKKLEKFGFVHCDNKYVYIENFMDNKFKAIVLVSNNGFISGKVMDNLSHEEYMPLRIESFDGEYVCRVREAYTNILKKICNACCTPVLFMSNQANRIAKFVRENYKIKPDFPWKDDKGVFRHIENKKWFGLIMHVNNHEFYNVDIINLKKDLGKEVLYDRHGIYPGYHMNHKMWVSIVLDDTLDDETILRLIRMSFDLTK